jgi:hypothetical protein
MQAREALLYAPGSRTRFRLILGSSAVEHPTVNRMVAGSNPARGAKALLRFTVGLAGYAHTIEVVGRARQSASCVLFGIVTMMPPFQPPAAFVRLI